MTLALTILGILAAFTPLIVQAIKDRKAKKADPNEQNKSRKEEIAREVIQDDEESANRSLDAELERLRQLQGDKQRQASNPTKGK